MVLEAIDEQDFLDWSYGFRPGCRAQDAVRAIDGIADKNQMRWVLEADIMPTSTAWIALSSEDARVSGRR